MTDDEMKIKMEKISTNFRFLDTKIRDITATEIKKTGLSFTHRELVYLHLIKQIRENSAKDFLFNIGVTKSTISNQAKKLKKKGFIEIVTDKNDARKRIFNLTPLGEKGSEIYLTMKMNIAKNLSQVLSPEQVDSFDECLELIANHIKKNSSIY